MCICMYFTETLCALWNRILNAQCLKPFYKEKNVLYATITKAICYLSRKLESIKHIFVSILQYNC